MPIFEYKCNECGKKFESLSLDKNSPQVSCPHCKSQKVEKQFSSFASGSSKVASKGFTCPSGGCCPGCNQQ